MDEVRCDICGKYIDNEDFGKGATKTMVDEDNFDVICAICNKD